jgi:uncharacterized protein YciI
MEIKSQPVYYVVFFITKYASLQEAKQKASEEMTAHLVRSKQFHEQGKLLLSGAFLDNPEEPVSTMAVLTSYEAADEYAKGDPFLLQGMVSKWYIRKWANMLV